MIMHQRFVELGEGYGDLYELLEIMKTNSSRLHKTYIFTSHTARGQVFSVAASFAPAAESHFMPIYICREGISQPSEKPSKRMTLFETMAEELNSKPVLLEMKNSSAFADRDLYYQYVIGILRLNHLLPVLS